MASARKKKSISRAVGEGTANAAVGVTGSVFRVIGTIFLILVVTALLFLCILSLSTGGFHPFLYFQF